MMTKRRCFNAGIPSRPPSFAFELNKLSREIDAALIARAGGVVLASVAGLGLALAPAPANAAIFEVDNTTDGNDASCTDGDCSLREAVAAANANPGPDTVDASGITGTTITLSNGEIAITDELTVTGPGAASLAVDANYASRIFNNTSGQALTLYGLTLTNGNTSDYGGAIYSNSDLTLNDVVVRNNESLSDGGGLYVYYGDVTLTDSTVSGNTAGGSGGGIYVSSGLSYTDANVTLTNSTVSGNTADASGGGIAVTGHDSANATLSLTGTTVSGNSTTNGRGDGIFVAGGDAYYAPGGDASVTLNSSTVSGNAVNSGGGGIFVSGGDSYGWFGRRFGGDATVVLNNSTVSGHTSDAGGGGIYVVGGEALGFFYYAGGGDASVTLNSSTVSGNSAVGSGGGIMVTGGEALGYYYYAGGGDARVTLNSSTVSGNNADAGGGGIFVIGGQAYGAIRYAEGPGIAVLNNSILADNTASSNPAIYASDSLAADYTLVEDGTGTALTDGANGNIVGADPGLAPLADNGGPTQTQAIGAGSPAFNAGDPAFTAPPNYDQRGAPYAREVFGTVDMGAYEFQGPIPVTLAIDKTSLNENGSDNPATISACLPAGVTAFEDVALTLDVTGAASPGTDHDLSDGAAVVIGTGSQCGTIAMNALDDAAGEPDESVVLDIATLPPDYSEGNPNQVTALIADDDVPGITVNPTSLTTTEAGVASTFTVVLNTQPTANVSIALSSSDLTEGTVNPANVTFTPGDWSAAKTVTVTGVDDTEVDGDIAFSIVTAAASSTDPNYNGRDPADVAVVNADDDVPAVAVSQLSLSVTNIREENPSAKAGLKSAHTSQITVTLDAPAPGEVTVSLGFTGQAQSGTDFTVTGNPVVIPVNATSGFATVTAIPDNAVEGDETFTATVLTAACAPACSVTLPDPPPSADGVIVDDDQALAVPAAPIPALGPLGLLLLPLLIPIAGWRYLRGRRSDVLATSNGRSGASQ